MPATIVVISDGETTVGRPNDEAIDAANEAGVPVSTIAFGTDDGVIFIEGEAIPVPPDLEAMEQIADATGGVFFEAESEQELDAVYADLGSRSASRPRSARSPSGSSAALVGLLGAAV